MNTQAPSPAPAPVADPNPVPASTLFGGEHVTISFRDPQRPAAQVFVREIRPSEYNALLAVSHSMTAMVEFLTGSPDGFGDAVTTESLFRLHDKGLALNPSFGPWLERQGPLLLQLQASQFGAHASARV